MFCARVQAIRLAQLAALTYYATKFCYSISVSKIASSDWFDTLMRVSSIPTVLKMIGMLPYKEELRKKMVTDRMKDRITFAGAYFVIMCVVKYKS